MALPVLSTLAGGVWVRTSGMRCTDYRSRGATVAATAEAAVEVDRATLVVALWHGGAMRFVTENNATAVRHFEPAFEPRELRLKDVRPAQQIPKCRLTFMNEKGTNRCIYSCHRVRISDLDEGSV